MFQNDGTAINETWRRCEPTQGDNRESHLRTSVTTSQTFQTQPCLSGIGWYSRVIILICTSSINWLIGGCMID